MFDVDCIDSDDVGKSLDESLSMEAMECTQDEVPDEQRILDDAVARLERVKCNSKVGEAIDERPMPSELARAMVIVEQYTVTGSSKGVASRALAQLEKCYTKKPKKQSGIGQYFKPLQSQEEETKGNW